MRSSYPLLITSRSKSRTSDPANGKATTLVITKATAGSATDYICRGVGIADAVRYGYQTGRKSVIQRY